MLALLVGCGEAEPVDPCPGGVCLGPDGGSADSGPVGADGGPVGTDGGPVGTDGGPVGADGGPVGADADVPDGGPGCVEAWQCSPWQTDGSSSAGTRSCTDMNGCGTTTSRPTMAADLPDLDVEFYECQVEPILERSCAHLGCHGTESGRALRLYARGRLRVTGHEIPAHPSWPCPIRPSESCIGSLDCTCSTNPLLGVERRRSYDSARSFMLDSTGAPLADPSRSELVRQPARGAGFAHAGVHTWRESDADAQTIVRWFNGERLGRTCGSNN